MTGVIIIICWVVGAATAYPRHKKWVMTDCDIAEWTNSEMIFSIVTCAFMWWAVWGFFLLEKVSAWDWLYKKSKF